MDDDALTQDERDKAHSSVRVDVLCVENSHGCHVVIGVGRVIVQRHHKHNVPFLNSNFSNFRSTRCAVVEKCSLHGLVHQTK